MLMKRDGEQLSPPVKVSCNLKFTLAYRIPLKGNKKCYPPERE